MSKSAAILGLAAIAYATAPAYDGGSSSSVPAYPEQSSYGAPSASYAPSSVYDPSSSGWPAPSGSASAYPSGSASAYPSGSAYYPSSSSYPSGYVPSSASYYPSGSVSSGAPTSFPTPTCWSACFQEAGVTSEGDLCGNEEVDQCIHDGCDCEDSNAYWSWYNSYCPEPSYSASYYPSSSSYPADGYAPSSSVSVSASATPTIECWGKCFAENDITSEEELCGNTAVDECISESCSCEDDKTYWQWYESFCTASPSSTPTVPAVPTASSTPEDCWGQCFEEAGIASEDELCGNTAVDQCIHDTCSPAEDKAYWDWYMSYCTVESPVTTPIVTATSYPSSTPSAAVDGCWSECFAENDVTSEASLCGNDAVSQCIHDTCSAALDKAYWDWYDGFCVATSTGYTTCTTVYTPITTPYEPVTTTYVSTETYGWAPVSSAPVTGLPVPPAGPAGGYSAGAYSTPTYSGVAQPTGTGYGAPSASAWSPVPATGAGAIAKPGLLLGAVMAVAALF